MPRHVLIASRLDDGLFESGAWFAIDAENRRVSGVSVASLAHGTTLIGRGRVATVVGRLRPGFAAIDVDVEGVMGEAITEALAAWCRERGVWHVVRPSGGAAGRHHVVVATHGVEDDLAELVATTRTMWRVGRTKVDLRRDIRPLSCPHRRSGEIPRIIGDARAALASLWKLLETLPAPATPSRRPRGSARVSTRRRARAQDATDKTSARDSKGGGEVRVPRRTRPRRRLEEKWATYLATGRRPAWKRADEAGVDATNSTFELMCTAAMLRAGFSHDEAWQAITRAHPDAMSRARASRTRWTRLVWRAVVDSDDAFTPTPTIDPAVWAATQQARERLRSCTWSLPVRQRTSVLVVGEVVLRRMETTNSLRVPVPERDLVLDTTIRDRKTIRAALRLLGQDVGTLHRDSLELRRKTSSSYEFEITPARGGVSEIPPPSFHTPLPAALPAHLTLSHWLTLRHLHTTRTLTPAQLTTLTQRPPSPTSNASAPLTRAQQHLLTDLQVAGLAHCDAAGGWTRPEHLPLAAPAHEDHASLREHVAAERAAWRSGHRSRWEAERQIAHEELRQRHSRWWRSLPSEQRRARLTALSARFDASSVSEQAALKRRLTRRDEQRGIDPAARRDAWWHAHSPEQQQQRIDARLRRWHALSHPEQVAHARAWSDHRRNVRGSVAAAYRLEALGATTGRLPLTADPPVTQWRP